MASLPSRPIALLAPMLARPERPPSICDVGLTNRTKADGLAVA
jgi:D-serine dehydratase